MCTLYTSSKERKFVQQAKKTRPTFDISKACGNRIAGNRETPKGGINQTEVLQTKRILRFFIWQAIVNVLPFLRRNFFYACKLLHPFETRAILFHFLVWTNKIGFPNK
jgi:hypothetical protein